MFELGVEGEDWKAIGDDRYEQIKSDDNEAYSFPGYVLTRNPELCKIPDTLMRIYTNTKSMTLTETLTMKAHWQDLCLIHLSFRQNLR